LLEKNLLKTYVSVAVDQTSEKYDYIQDRFVDLGAFGAVCSAFQYDPNKAWLVLAADLPFVNNDLIQLLLKRRNPTKVATAVKGKSKEFVEPLIAIYEPKAYPKLLSYLAQGYSCPRKVLINSDVEIVEVDDELIRNINTPEEYQQVLKELK
ncbi:MAG: NTP transferase domain-containing protein, partial [Flavobacteriaceae bacterium]|nr:NTP transferase domain-containing protein [Flavobacteriaceae bacterium]